MLCLKFGMLLLLGRNITRPRWQTSSKFGSRNDEIDAMLVQRVGHAVMSALTIDVEDQHSHE